MTLPETMSGVQLTRHGGPETLVWNDDIPVRKPGAGEVLVRVKAAGVNNTDVNTRIGWYSSAVTNSTADVDPDAEIEDGGWSGALPFPLIQGGDLCGEIVALGEGVNNFEVGMRVTSATVQAVPTKEEPTKFVTIGSEYDGAFAQYCTLPADQVFDVSASPLSDQEIAALPCAFGTAMGLLTRAQVAAGDRVLITGASGGVGMAAVQLAKLRGAEITGIASPAKQADVLAAGARDCIARGEVPQAQSYNVVIDLVGGDDWPDFINALKPSGRYAVSGAIAGPIVAADLRTIYLNDLTLLGSTYQPKEVFAELVELINDGKIKPLISKTYPLSDIATAQEDFISKQYPGKLVLIPPQ
ncbi:alcohol dehydrogenase catalytic domain-containing protein [Kiloniella sp.]|uniref:alcohol dehydrogenase catalytic domain-containing protein n=1 Tax=Kiloniella sp. TaxID=1938587 RepID=UPI003B02A40C